MDLIPNHQIFKIKGDTVHYLQLRQASIEADAFVTTAKGRGEFHQPNSAGGLRPIHSFEEACELGQRAAMRLKELTGAVSGR